MADLIAQGKAPHERWRRTLPEGEPVLLGRAPHTWSVPWDKQLSRVHAELCWRHGKLAVRREPKARNLIFLRGQPADDFSLTPGESFVTGNTIFTLADEQPTILDYTAPPIEELSFRAQDLEQVEFRDPVRRLEILGKLPEIISGAINDEELFLRLGNLLLAGIPHADAVAVVCVGRKEVPEVLFWDARVPLGANFQPSARLIRRAVEIQQSVSQAWAEGTSVASVAGLVGLNLDWAFCTPVRGEATAGWALYAAGKQEQVSTGRTTSRDAGDLQMDLKFTELVAAILASLRQVRLLQTRQALLSQFFSPSVLRALGDTNGDTLLAPQETEVSVLFCDLRGFSREADRSSSDLLGLLHRVGRALGVMTRHILDNGGVIAGFQGDAVLGFWGWPLAQADAVPRACRTALAIRSQFEAARREAGHPLADFRMGIGIATGRAVVGKIGSSDQGQVSVFGPVVNLASRLEGMTKLTGASILLDEATARLAHAQLPCAAARWRRVGRVRPYGMDTALLVTEMLPDAAECPEPDAEAVAAYEAALDAFLIGRWSEAGELLRRAASADPVRKYLSGFLLESDFEPPPGWDGVIALTSKG